MPSKFIQEPVGYRSFIEMHIAFSVPPMEELLTRESLLGVTSHPITLVPKHRTTTTTFRWLPGSLRLRQVILNKLAGVSKVLLSIRSTQTIGCMEQVLPSMVVMT